MSRNMSYVLADEELQGLIDGEWPRIVSTAGVQASQVQPASIDLTLGNEVFGMGSGGKPGRLETVRHFAEKNCQYRFTLDEDQEGFLHVGYTYLIPLRERLKPLRGFSAKFNPKSSTGREDIFVRVVLDHGAAFDKLPENYDGELWLEVTSNTFPIQIVPGVALVQMRVKCGEERLSEETLRLRQNRDKLLFDKKGRVIPPHQLETGNGGIYMHVDFDRDVIGFKARRYARHPISLAEEKKGILDWHQYWTRIYRDEAEAGFVIDPEVFYLLATKERIRIPTDICGDVAAFDAATGEFRTHYAGFFDPGFGGETGTVGVLEVRGRESPHRLQDGDSICLMTFEQVSRVKKPYKGHYDESGPSLSKRFRDRFKAWGLHQKD